MDALQKSNPQRDFHRQSREAHSLCQAFFRRHSMSNLSGRCSTEPEASWVERSRHSLGGQLLPQNFHLALGIFEGSSIVDDELGAATFLLARHL